MRFYHLLAVVFVGLCVACGGGNRPAAAGKVWTEAELLAIVGGKTPEQVIALIGPPTATYGTNRDVFHYRDSIRNPYTGKLDTAFVYFEGGVVTKIKGH